MSVKPQPNGMSPDATRFGPPDTIFLNAKVITADSRFSLAEAVAIKGDRFVAVGKSKDIEALADHETKIIDLKGRTVLPGLIDTHAHVEYAGRLSLFIDFGGVSNVEEAVARIASQAARTPKGKWIQCNAWHPASQLAEKRFLTRQELDRAAPDHPVCLSISHFTMANTMAMALAGITKDTPDPIGGIIHRDATGEPNGVLEEAAERLVCDRLPDWTPDELADQVQAAMAYFNSFGITSAISAAANPATLRAHQRVLERGGATLRVSAMYSPTGGINPDLNVDELETLLSRIGIFSGFGNEWLSFSGLKLQIDGGMTLRTAAMREGYPHDPNYHGTVVIEPAKFNAFVAAANRYGWRVGVHAVGDAAIDAVLDGFSLANEEKSIKNRRFIVIHGSLMRADQMERAKHLGVRVDAQSAFLWGKAPAIAKYLGKETADRVFPMRTMIDVMGLEMIGQGTDFPFNDLNPFVNMYIMISRKDQTGTIYGYDEAITREEAIRLYTSAASRYSFSEEKTGSIEPGKLADLVVLSDDILEAPVEALQHITAVRTVVGGSTVYEAEPA